jgi:hypothetical protein
VPQIGKSEALSTLTDDQQLAVKAAMLFASETADAACSHGEAWSLKPGGVSKTTGKPYQPFWAASHKAPDGSWCREKPSIKWINAQKAPEPIKLVPQDDPSEIPF